MSRLLIIGCGGVAQVAIHKCCQNSEVFTEICIASKTKSKCDAIKAELEGKTKTVITTAEIDAMDVAKTVELIKSYKPDAVLNVALPYQDLAIMDACVLFMRNAAKRKAFQHFLTTLISGLMLINIRRLDLQHFLGQALIRV